MYLPHREDYGSAFLAFNFDPLQRLKVTVAADSLRVSGACGPGATLLFKSDPLTLRCSPSLTAMPVIEGMNLALAAAEALFARQTGTKHLRLGIARASDLRAALIASGAAISEGGELRVIPELFFQLPLLWLPKKAVSAFPQIYVMTNGMRHPLRPPRSLGVAYARFIPWLGRVLSFQTINVEAHLPLFNRWMNEPQVNKIWEEGGSLDKHRSYLQERVDDPHVLPLIGYFDQEAFGYFEVYWAKENRLGPYYSANDYDRGWHVAVGEPAFRGKAWISAWLPSLMHFMFLDDPRTQRIVGEPSASHAQQIRNLERSGFSKIKHFDFPHKRALLVMLLRERFFGDRLWLPSGQIPDGSTAENEGAQCKEARAR